MLASEIPERKTARVYVKPVEMGNHYFQEKKKGLHILNLLDHGGFQPCSEAYVRLLQQCIIWKSLTDGKQVHKHIITSGFQSDVIVASTLMNMYIKCGSIEDADTVFEQMPVRDVVSWNVMIAGYTKHGQSDEAVKSFWDMKCAGVKPSKITFVSVLKACTDIASLDQGRQIHLLMKSEVISDAVLDSTLVDMYVKCGSIEEACQVFNKMLKRDVVSWNVMIAGYAKQGQPEEAFKLFQQMQQEGVKPNQTTIGSILKACAEFKALDYGRNVHVDALNYGMNVDPAVGSSLVDMYAKCGSIEDAREVFDKLPTRDVVSYNVMIAGYAHDGNGKEPFELFAQMQHEGMKPDKITYVSMLKACVSLSSLEHGKQVHADLILNGFGLDMSVGTTLIDMYSKCGSTEHARRVFDKLPTRNVISWTAMIAGYAQNEQVDEALKHFWKMKDESVKPNEATFISVLKACAHGGALEQGRKIHGQITESGFGSDISVGSTLIDMYGKCGNIKVAHQLFDELPKHDLVSWTAIIAGYAQHGHGKEALELVKRMLLEGVTPDRVTFISILASCSHVGLVEDGLNYFKSMMEVYCITPTVEHYACIVDLLGRAGHLEEAEEFIEKMPCRPTAMILTALLGACRIHGNVELAKRASERLLHLEPRNTAAFVQLSNIYAKAGMWAHRAKIRQLMEERGVKKQTGCCYIEVDNKVYAFGGDGMLQYKMTEINAELKRFSEQRNIAALLPDTCFSFHGFEEEGHGIPFCYHSDKFAIAWGLTNTPPGTTIRIFKNFPACVDCHDACKFISISVGRVIIVRDANRFHHFENGLCSCRDIF